MIFALRREEWTLQCVGCLFIIIGPILGMWFVFFGNRISPLDEAHSMSACTACDYNLTGNTSGICPECGTPIPEEIQKRLTTKPLAE